MYSSIYTSQHTAGPLTARATPPLVLPSGEAGDRWLVNIEGTQHGVHLVLDVEAARVLRDSLDQALEDVMRGQG